jgi:AcrR family transcriptional regulator
MGGRGLGLALRELDRPAARTRDAARSREVILDAAERVFAKRGFEAASLSEIGAAAGLSRGTPGYFFGSKQHLYIAVLERVFADRQAATAQAFAPVLAWCDGSADLRALRRAIANAAEAYTGFLLQRPAFVRLLVWEELAGGQRLRAARRHSTAMQDAFGALADVSRARGLRRFDPGDAVLLFISLTFAPLAHQSTLMVAMGRELGDARLRRRHTRLVVDQVMCLIAPRAA